MEVFSLSVPVFALHLRNLERYLDKAVAHAEQKKFDPEVLMQARLSPDQWPLLRQITAACDAAKWGVAKLAGKEAPSHPDTETSIAEVRARLKTVLEYLETFKPEDFVGAEERLCKHSWMGERSMRGQDYLMQFALPNFLFHVATAYAILRHNGVPLAKQDYLGKLTLK
jgi:hypothetical protein